MLSSKEKLRPLLRQVRSSMTKDYKCWADRAIQAHLFKIWFEKKELLHWGTYVPFAQEPDLIPFMAFLAQNGIFVYGPHTTSENNLVFCPWRMDKPLVLGRYGIWEPVLGPCTVSPEVVLLPMLGWSEKGYRIGYGQGCFDRFFSKNKNILRIGVSYECLKVSSSFEEKHDIPVDILVTETGWGSVT